MISNDYKISLIDCFFALANFAPSSIGRMIPMADRILIKVATLLEQVRREAFAEGVGWADSTYQFRHRKADSDG